MTDEGYRDDRIARYSLEDAKRQAESAAMEADAIFRGVLSPDADGVAGHHLTRAMDAVRLEEAAQVVH